MKTLATVFGISTFMMSGMIAPFSALGQTSNVEPAKVESELKAEQALPETPIQLSKKMAIYNECVETHSRLNGADFKQVNKFCSCVVDQSVQGDNSGFGTCASGSSGGGAMSIISEVAPSVITGVMEGINNRSSRSGGGLSGLGGLLGGGSGGGLIDGLGGLLGGSGSGGGFNIKDILKNRF
jgi:hypothetical protein